MAEATSTANCRRKKRKMESKIPASKFSKSQSDIVDSDAQQDDSSCVKGEMEVQNGLLFVKPYHYEFTVNVKERWRGSRILDVFLTEFRTRDRQYYEVAISSGRILVNNALVTADYVLHNGDRITHKMHRHEPAALAQYPTVVKETEFITVIDKPASIPVHAQGVYNYLSLLSMLTNSLRIEEKLYSVHRLDRLTSGLILFAKNAKFAQRLSDQWKDDSTIRKYYLARIEGDLPQERVEVCEPIRTLAHEVESCLTAECHPEGKPAKTVFERISTNGSHTIVKCSPLTGRTHQIRVHLKHLGCPIANDPIYNDRFKAVDATVEVQWPMSLYEKSLCPECENASFVTLQDAPDRASSASSSASPSLSSSSYRLTVSIPPLHIWLHAYRYELPDLEVEGPWPDWTKLK